MPDDLQSNLNPSQNSPSSSAPAAPSGSPAPNTPPSANGSPPPTPNSPPPTPPAAGDPPAPPPVKATRPDWAPETAWDAEKGTYKDDVLRETFTREAAERSRKLTLPQKPEDLPLELPKDFTVPQGIEFKLDEANPMIAPAKAFALKHGLTKEGWSELLALSGASAVMAAQQRKTFVEGEIAKLGVNGTPRVTAITDFQKAYFGDEGMVKAMLPTTAKAVEGWERLIRERQTQGAGNYPGGNREPPPPKTEIQNYDGMTFEQRRAAQVANQRRGAA